MKKIFTCVMMLVMGLTVASAECQDGPYGLQINGSKVVDAPKFGDPDTEGRIQYKASCVKLEVGDEVKLINQSCGETWMINLDPYGDYANFDGGKEAGKLTCKTAGSYDFYIKLSMEKGDLIYVELGKDCGGGSNPGGGGGGSTIPGNPRFMWKAELDGDWQEPRDATTFVNGECSIMFYTSCYLFLIYQVDGSAGVEYMLDAYSTDTHVRFRQGAGEKWGVPVGTTNLYLYDNGDGSVELSNQPMPGKKPWGATESIDNTFVTEKAQKVFIDGQLRIVRGDKVFDATGRQL
ncbi:MAG: hypothetical protein IJQ32_03565 [Paludibacteraceae bacterium]|nr:hypothetical protein [Paludibacteraceae bacterium]